MQTLKHIQHVFSVKEKDFVYFSHSGKMFVCRENTMT
jgi:hypothetical protein